MCLCVLALPFTLCYFRAGCEDACCDCMNDHCTVNFNEAVEECECVCCCLSPSTRLLICDVLEWPNCCCRQCRTKVASDFPAGAAVDGGATQLPAAASMSGAGVTAEPV